MIGDTPLVKARVAAMARVALSFGYMDRERVSVGSLAEPYSFSEAVQQAQDIGARLITNAEYQRALAYAERNDRELLVDLYGNKFGSPGYAGARELTDTVINLNDCIVKDVDGLFSKHLFGGTSYYQWLADVISHTRSLQESGLTAYVQDFDEEVGFPASVGPEPNPRYHGAIFWISPHVSDVGVVTRGIHHAVAEPCAKYDIMILPLDYKDIMLGHRTVSETSNANRNKLMSTAVAAGLLVKELFPDGRIERSAKELGKLAEHYLELNDFKGARINRRQLLKGGLATLAATLTGENAYAQFNKPHGDLCHAFNGLARASGRVMKRIANDDEFDNAPLTRGKITFRNGSQTFQAYIGSDGTYRTNGVIPVGRYEVTIEDLDYTDGFSTTPSLSSVGSGTYFVPHRTTIWVECPAHSSVIERGPNRLGVEFDNNFQAFYAKIAQRNHQTRPGVIKWGNGAYELLNRIRIVGSTIPDDIKTQFRDLIVAIVNRDTRIYSGERLTTLPVEFGEVGTTLEIEMRMENLPASLADYTAVFDRYRIGNARIRFQLAIADRIRFGFDPSSAFSHEFFHGFGAAV